MSSSIGTPTGGASENGGDKEFSKDKGVPFLFSRCCCCSRKKAGDGGAILSARLSSMGAFSFSESPLLTPLVEDGVPGDSPPSRVLEPLGLAGEPSLIPPPPLPARPLGRLY